MKKLPLLLLPLIVVVLISGCEEGAQYLAASSAAICSSTADIINVYADDKGNRDNWRQVSNALSAWCWLDDCIETMNMIIGDNEELEELFDKLRQGCGNCFQTSELESYAPPGIYRQIENICDGHTQYHPRDPEVIA